MAVNVPLTGAARQHALLDERFDRTYAVLDAWLADHTGSGYTNSVTDYAAPRATTNWVGPVPRDLVRRLAAVKDGVPVRFRAARYTEKQLQAAVDALVTDFTQSTTSASRRLAAVSPALLVVSYAGRPDGSGLDLTVAKTTTAAVSDAELRAVGRIVAAHADLPASVSRGSLAFAAPAIAAPPSPRATAAQLADRLWRPPVS